MNATTNQSATPVTAAIEALFGDTYWWKGTRYTGPAALRPDETNTAAYRDVVDNLPTLCWIADADGYITWYNRRWHEYCGTTPEEMEGWGWQSVHDPAVLPAVMEAWTGSIASGDPFEMTFPLRGADGVFRPFLTRIIPLRDEAGQVRRWIGNNIDVSRQIAVELELRRAQEGLEQAHRALAEREAFLASVLASSTDCIKVLDLEGKLTFMSEGGQRVMEVSDFNTIAGCPWPDFWQGAGNAEAVAAIEAAHRGEARSFIGKASTMKGTPRWWHVAVSPIAAADGTPARILSVSRDITDLRASEEERDRFVRLAENSNDFVGMARTDGSVFYMNDAARRLVGLEDADIVRLSIADFFPPEQATVVAQEVLPAVDRDGHWAGELSFRHFGTGELIPVLYSVFPITDASGALMGYGTVTRDYRGLKRAEEDMRLMNGELAHRLKNVLAVVQSIAQQTLRSASDTTSAAENLGSRLMALGAATDVLTGASWRSADLRAVAEGALAPHGNLGERILIEGPAVTLKPEVTVAFALALHELATNAAKYGALSNETGTVSLSWTIDGTGSDATFVLVWREQGGPPVSAPQRKGFGSALIERSLRSYFSGKAATDYRPDGLVFELQARLGDAAITGK